MTDVGGAAREKHDLPDDVGREFVRALNNELEAWRRRLEERRDPGGQPPPAGDPIRDDEGEDAFRAVVSALVEAALFSSMATEEGRTCRPSLVWASAPEKLDGAVRRFKKAAPLHVDIVRKLAPLCECGETFLVVDPAGEQIIGTFKPRPTRNLFTALGDESVRIYAPRPGLIICARGQREVIRYEQGRIVDAPPWPFLREREPLSSITDALLGSGSAEQLAAFLSEVFLRVLVELRALECGGIVAVLGRGETLAACADEAKELEPPLPLGSDIRDALRTVPSGVAIRGREPSLHDYKRAFDEHNAWTKLADAEREIARLASVDGALILNSSLDAMAFAAKLKVGELPGIYRVNPDGQLGDVYSLDRRGLRHRAAASFAAANPERIVFMVSQDGGATVFFHIDTKVAAWPIDLPYQR